MKPNGYSHAVTHDGLVHVGNKLGTMYMVYAKCGRVVRTRESHQASWTRSQINIESGKFASFGQTVTCLWCITGGIA